MNKRRQKQTFFEKFKHQMVDLVGAGKSQSEFAVNTTLPLQLCATG